MVLKILTNSVKDKEWPTWSCLPSFLLLELRLWPWPLRRVLWRSPHISEVKSLLGTLLGWLGMGMGQKWGWEREEEGGFIRRKKLGQPRILLWEFKTTGLEVLMVIIILATSLAHSPHYCRALKTLKLPWWSWFNPCCRLYWLWSVWSGWC